MRSAACLVLAAAALAHADERADRLAIKRIVASLNERFASGGPLSQFFSSDAEKELAALQDLDRRLHPSAQQPWSEVTAPSIVVASLRFVTADVAIADAASTRFGSTIGVSRVPVLLILRREAAGWKIASVRVLLLRGSSGWYSPFPPFRGGGTRPAGRRGTSCRTLPASALLSTYYATSRSVAVQLA
jgi:hypothetical protein